MTLRELLGDVADRGRPGELAGPAWRMAHRMRARRRALTVATGAAAGLLLIVVPLTVRLLASGPSGPSGFPVATSSPSASPSGSLSAPPRLALPSLPPGQLPSGWIWGGGPDGNGGTLIHDRRRGSLIELPYDWAIPAPTGDLVFVANQNDDWAGVLNLATDAITPLQAPGTPFGPWSVGIPQWSADGTRLLRVDGQHLYLTDAVTGDSRRVNLQGGCVRCSSVVWLPGETEVAIPVSSKETDGLQVYSMVTGEKLRRVPWFQARLHGFSPDGRYVVAQLDGSAAIVDVAGGGRVAKIDADDTRAAYWAGPDVVLVIGRGGAVAYSLQGIRIQWYAWPERLGDDELANFTLIRRD